MAASRSSSLRNLAKRVAYSANSFKSHPAQTAQQIINPLQGPKLRRGIFSGEFVGRQQILIGTNAKRGAIFKFYAGNSTVHKDMSTTPSVEEREAEKMVWEGGGPHTEMWSGGSDSEDSVIFNSAADQVQDTADSIKKAGGKAVKNASETIKGMGENVKDTVKGAAEKGKQAMNDASQSVKEMMGFAKEAGKDVSRKAQDTAEDASDSARHAANRTANSVKGAADKAKDMSAGAGEKLKDAAGDVKDHAKKLADTDISETETAKTAASWTSKVAQGIKDAGEGAVKTVQDTTFKITERVSDTVISTAVWASEAVENETDLKEGTKKSIKEGAEKVADKADRR